MQIPLESAVDRFIAYMSDQVATIPKLGDRFLGFAALGSLKSNPDMLIGKVKPWAEMAGIVSNGMVDTEMVRAALTMAFNNVPRVGYFGFTFTADDAAQLLARMEA